MGERPRPCGLFASHRSVAEGALVKVRIGSGKNVGLRETALAEMPGLGPPTLSDLPCAALRTPAGRFVLNNVHILAQNGVTKLTVRTPERDFESAQSCQFGSSSFNAGLHQLRRGWTVIN
jgi:hypothetical protein